VRAENPSRLVMGGMAGKSIGVANTHKKAPFFTGPLIKVIFIYLKTKQQASTNIIYIKITCFHTLKLKSSLKIRHNPLIYPQID
jgi:hypothetical protein